MSRRTRPTVVRSSRCRNRNRIGRRPRLELLEDRRLLALDVFSDQAAYELAEPVTITVQGLAAGETAQFQLTYADGTPPGDEGSEPWEVTDGGLGDLDAEVDGVVQIVISDHELPGQFRISVTGLQSETSDNVEFAILSGEPLQPAPQVFTDKSDYAPGETAAVFAGNFAVGETVEFQVLHIDEVPNTGEGHDSWQIVDGGPDDLDGAVDGNIHTTWFVSPDDSLDSEFELTATGLTSGSQASWQFTDALIVGTPDVIVSDNFDSGRFASWWQVKGADIDRDRGSGGPVSPPSSPYAAEFDGDSNELLSQGLNISKYHFPKIRFAIQAQGNENRPETGDPLKLWYWTNANKWKVLKEYKYDPGGLIIPGVTITNYNWANKEVFVPSDAHLTNFAFGFTAYDSDVNAFGVHDDWFVDDVALVGFRNRKPKIDFSGSSSGTVFDSAVPSFSWQVTDPDLDGIQSVSVTVKRGSKTIPPGSNKASGKITPDLKHGLGKYTIYVSATDTMDGGSRIGDPASASHSFTVRDQDVTPPVITLSGSEGTESEDDKQSFTWKIVDSQSGVDTASTSVSVTRNGIVIPASVSSKSNDTFPFDRYGPGTYEITVSTRDKDNDRPGDSLPSSAQRRVVVNAAPVAFAGQDQTVTEGSTTFFDASATFDLEQNPLTYLWDFGDGTTSTVVQPAHAFSDNGTYTVSLTATDSFGGSSTDTLQVQVSNAKPLVEAGVSQTTSEGLPVSFAGSFTDPGTADSHTILWDFGDGTTAGGTLTPNHTYADDGIYSVKLTVTDDDGGESSDTITVVAENAPPRIVSLTNSGPIAAGQVVSVNVVADDVAGDPLTYAFDFDNDGTLETTNTTGAANHVFSGSQVYPVSVRVTDDDGGETTGVTAVLVGATAATTPAVTFETATQTAAEGGTDVSVVAQMAQSLPVAAVVPVTVTGSAEPSADFTLANSYLFFPAGSTAATLDVSLIDDTLDEALESITLTMSSPVNASLGTITTHTIDILDNDEPPFVSFTSAGQTIEENVGAVSVTARLSTASGQDVVVPLSFAGSAVNPADYLPQGTSLFIPAGFRTGEVSLSIVDDTLSESSERIDVALGTSPTARLSTFPGDPLSQTLIISPNDAPTVTFSSIGTNVGEAIGTVTAKVNLSNPSADQVTVDFTTSGTANANDYSTTPQAQLVFPPLSTVGQIQINVTDDNTSALVIPPRLSVTRLRGGNNPLQGVAASAYSSPAMGDIDGDGDLDLVSGGELGGFDFFLNTGTAVAPNFELRVGGQNPLQGVDVGDHSAPTLADLDGDGDLDLVAGHDRGIAYFENTGSILVPSFTPRTGTENPFRGMARQRVDRDCQRVRVGTGFPVRYEYQCTFTREPVRASVTLGDLDNDGDLDLLVGRWVDRDSQDGPATGPRIRVFKNVGTAAEPEFVRVSLGAHLTAFRGEPASRPSLGDIDGDGDLDLVIGNVTGGIQFFENTGTASSPKLIQRFGSLTNPLHGQLLGADSAPVFGDIDADGDFDIVSGTMAGGFAVLETRKSAEPEHVEERLRETIVVDLVSSEGIQFGPTQAFVLEVEDDDVPNISLNSIADVWEDIGQIAVSATLSRPSTNEVILPLGLLGEGNHVGSVWEDLSFQGDSQIVIQPGQLSGSALLVVNDDLENEWQESFTIITGNPENAFQTGPDRTTFTVRDNDPHIFLVPEGRFSEGQSAAFHVRLQYPTNKAVEVPYQFQSATAIEGVDYRVTGPAAGVVTIPPLETERELVDFGFLADNIVEPLELFTMKISSPGHAIVLPEQDEPFGAPGELIEQFVPVRDTTKLGLQIEFPDSGTNRHAVPEDAGEVPLTVRLTNPVSFEVTVELTEPRGIRSTAGQADRAFPPRTKFVIPAGSQTATSSINVLDDDFRENSETVGFSARIAGNEHFEKVTADDAVLTILDNDEPITVTTTTPPGTLIVSDTPQNLDVVTGFPGIGLPPLTAPAVDCGIPLTLCIYTGVDGFISGGTAFFDGNLNGIHDFLDLNGNGLQEPGELLEPITTTEVDGSFALAVPAGFDRNSNGTIEESDGQIVLTGGIDESTGLPLDLSLTAPAGFFAVSPVSTLVNQLVREHGFTAADASRRTLEALGIEDVDLRRLNPVAGHLNGDTTASAVFAAGAMVQDTVIQISRLVAGVPGAAQYPFVADRAFADMADKIVDPGARLNLTLAPVVRALINGVLLRTATSLDPQLVSAAAQVIADTNQHLATLSPADSENYLRSIARTQAVSQGMIADNLSATAAGLQPVTTLTPQFTAEPLRQLIADAQVHNVLPPLLAVTDVSDFETEGQHTLEFTVALLREAALPVTVDYTTADGSATVADGDYQPVFGTLTWEPGDTSERKIEVNIQGDDRFELDEYLLLVLSNATNAALRKDIGVGGIVNDDAFVYQAAANASGNRMDLLLENGQVQLRHNGETVLDGIFTLPVPLTIVGDVNSTNELHVQLAGDNPIVAGGVFFQGGAAQDTFTIFDRLSNNSVHVVAGNGAGQFDVDGAIFQYSDVESASDSLTPGIAGIDRPSWEGSEIELRAVLPAGVLPEEATYDWELTQDGASIAAGTADTLAYTPPEDGEFSARLTLSAANGGTGTTQVTVSVDNADPTAQNDSGSTGEEGPEITIDVLANDSDPAADLDPLTVVAVDTTNTRGLVDFTPADTSYDPAGAFESLAAGEVGQDSFRYTIHDGDGGYATGTVNISVLGVNDPPTLSVPGPLVTAEDTPLAVAGITVGDVDTPILTVTLSVPAGAGTVALPTTAGTAISGEGTHSVQATGSINDINSALAAAQFSPAQNHHGSLNLLVAVTDGDLGTSQSVPITITPVNDAPQLANIPDLTFFEDGGDNSVDLDDYFLDVETLPEDATFEIVSSFSGVVATIDPVTHVLTLSAAPDFSGSGSITIRATDTGDGQAFESPPLTDHDSLQVTIVAVADPPDLLLTSVSGFEGTAIPLPISVGLTDTDGSESLGGVDIRGVPDIASLSAGTDLGSGNWLLSVADLSGLTMTVADDANFELTVTAHSIESSNLDTASTTDSLNVSVGNVNPRFLSLDSSNPTPELKSLDGSITINGLYHDDSSLDTHTITVNWGDGNGETLSADQSSNSYSGNHQYDTGGIFTITVTIVDDDGGTAIEFTKAVVSGVGLVERTLYVIGTDGKDVVNIHQPTPENGVETIQVVANLNVQGGTSRDDGGADVFLFDADDVSYIAEHLCGGDDHGRLTSQVAVDSELHGGDGDDKLSGGGAGDIMLGGDGNDDLRAGRDESNGGSASMPDILVGGGGSDKLQAANDRDILIGGRDDDDLNGQQGENLLVGGWTVFDTDVALLADLRSEWTSPGDYTDRVATLLAGSGSTGVQLLPLLTVFDDPDHVKDKVDGKKGLDWFLVDPQDDSVKGDTKGETVTDIDPPPLHAAATPPAAAAAAETPSGELSEMLNQAVQSWEQQGAAVRTASAPRIQVADLPGTYLGYATAGLIVVDVDAAGFGWFVDSSPADHEEFGQVVAQHERQASPADPAASRIDLLTVISHELGHLLGHADLPESEFPHHIMTERLGPGVRRMPGQESDSTPDLLRTPQALTAPLSPVQTSRPKQHESPGVVIPPLADSWPANRQRTLLPTEQTVSTAAVDQVFSLAAEAEGLQPPDDRDLMLGDDASLLIDSTTGRLKSW